MKIAAAVLGVALVGVVFFYGSRLSAIEGEAERKQREADREIVQCEADTGQARADAQRLQAAIQAAREERRRAALSAGGPMGGATRPVGESPMDPLPVLQAEHVKLRACYAAAIESGTLAPEPLATTLTFTVKPDGTVADTVMNPRISIGGVSDCMEAAVKALSFPAFEGEEPLLFIAPVSLQAG